MAGHSNVRPSISYLWITAVDMGTVGNSDTPKRSTARIPPVGLIPWRPFSRIMGDGPGVPAKGADRTPGTQRVG
jgi:hypothetical protein